MDADISGGGAFATAVADDDYDNAGGGVIDATDCIDVYL